MAARDLSGLINVVPSSQSNELVWLSKEVWQGAASTWWQCEDGRKRDVPAIEHRTPR